MAVNLSNQNLTWHIQNINEQLAKLRKRVDHIDSTLITLKDSVEGLEKVAPGKGS